MNYFLETTRLGLREFHPADIPFILSLDSDPRVMQYIRAPSVSMEDAEATYNKILNTRREDLRFGNWVAISKNTNTPIGWFCLKYLDGTAEIEVGYRLLYHEWNKGYATEGALGILEYGFNLCALTRIAAVTNPNNLASQHVLEKCGMHCEKIALFYGSLLKYYTIDAPRKK